MSIESQYINIKGHGLNVYYLELYVVCLGVDKYTLTQSQYILWLQIDDWFFEI